MNKELREALAWARKDGFAPGMSQWTYSHYLKLLADAAERSMELEPKSELRCPYCGSAHVIVTTHSGQWYWSCRNVFCLWSGPLKATQEEAIASAEVKPELRCPECGCDARLIESAHAGGGTFRWLCWNEDCGARGGRKPTKAEARASAEVKR